jgi:hypothetical protein
MVMRVIFVVEEVRSGRLRGSEEEASKKDTFIMIRLSQYPILMQSETTIRKLFSWTFYFRTNTY